MNLHPLMIPIQIRRPIKILPGFFLISQTKMPQTHQIMAMHTVSLIHIVFPYLQIRKRDGEIIHLERIEQMPLPKINQAIETSPGLRLATQPTKCQTLIKDFVRLLVVVIHRRHRLVEPD